MTGCRVLGLNSVEWAPESPSTFLALDCEPVEDNRQGLEEELMTIEKVPLQNIPKLIAEGELVDAKSLLGILLTLQYLDG